jgi:hypothetical protein
MNDSGSGEPSTTKTIDLKARLQQMKAQHDLQAQEIETEVFKNFEADLTNLLTGEGNTLANDFNAVTNIFSKQRERITSQVEKETRRMIWVVKIPLLLIAALCLLAMGLGVLWFRIENRYRVHLAPMNQNGQKYMVVDEPNWEVCYTHSEEVVLPATQKKVTAVHQEPCKPVR